MIKTTMSSIRPTMREGLVFSYLDKFSFNFISYMYQRSGSKSTTTLSQTWVSKTIGTLVKAGSSSSISSLPSKSPPIGSTTPHSPRGTSLHTHSSFHSPAVEVSEMKKKNNGTFTKIWSLSCLNCNCDLKCCMHCGTDYSKSTSAEFKEVDGAWNITCSKCKVVFKFLYCGACGSKFASDAYAGRVLASLPDNRPFQMSGYLSKVGKYLKSVKQRWYVCLYAHILCMHI
jgi:hypothetical protein